MHFSTTGKLGKVSNKLNSNQPDCAIFIMCMVSTAEYGIYAQTWSINMSQYMQFVQQQKVNMYNVKRKVKKKVKKMLKKEVKKKLHGLKKKLNKLNSL